MNDRSDQSSEHGGRDVIGMAFRFNRELKDLLARKWLSEHGIRAEHPGQHRRGTGAKTRPQRHTVNTMNPHAVAWFASQIIDLQRCFYDSVVCIGGEFISAFAFNRQ